MEKEEHELIDIILKNIRKYNNGILDSIHKYDKAIDEYDILSFILEKYHHKPLDTIVKMNTRWLCIDYYRKFKISVRKDEVFRILNPFIEGTFSIFNQKYIDLLIYKIDRNYKPYLDLDMIIRSNGTIDSRKCNKLFNELLEDLKITEKDFYDLVECEMYKYRLASTTIEFKDKLYNNGGGEYDL